MLFRSILLAMDFVIEGNVQVNPTAIQLSQEAISGTDATACTAL